MKLAVRLCLLVVVSVLVFGCGKPKEPENVPEMRAKLRKVIKYAMWKVDATDEQGEKVDKLIDRLAVDFFAYQQESNAIKKGLMKAFDEEIIDKSRIDAYHKQGVDLFGRYTKRMLDAIEEMSSILNLEQRKKLIKLWKEYEFGD